MVQVADRGRQHDDIPQRKGTLEQQLLRTHAVEQGGDTAIVSAAASDCRSSVHSLGSQPGTVSWKSPPIRYLSWKRSVSDYNRGAARIFSFSRLVSFWACWLVGWFQVCFR